MPRLVIAESGRRGLERCRRFLAERNPGASERAARVIDQQFQLLRVNPAIGRPFSAQLEFRELVIGFGDSGYVALYRHEPDDDAMYILAFRHQREAGY